MSERQIKEILYNENNRGEGISLKKLLGEEVEDIILHFNNEYNETCFDVQTIIFKNGTKVYLSEDSLLYLNLKFEDKINDEKIAKLYEQYEKL